MSEWVVLWRPPGYRPVSDGAMETLCNGDAEPALKAMREQAIIIKRVDHQWESSR